MSLPESSNPFWCFNVVDPSRQDFPARAVVQHEDEPQKIDILADWYRNYLQDYVLRDPQPTKQYSVDELKDMGFVGAYTR